MGGYELTDQEVTSLAIAQGDAAALAAAAPFPMKASLLQHLQQENKWHNALERKHMWRGCTPQTALRCQEFTRLTSTLSPMARVMCTVMRLASSSSLLPVPLSGAL